MTDEKPFSPPDQEDTKVQPLSEHLFELRNRILYSLLAFLAAFGMSYLFSDHIFAFLIKPLVKAFEAQNTFPAESRHLIYTGLADGLFTYIRVSLFSGLVLSFPLWITQIWRFVAPGLYEREKKLFIAALGCAPLLFLLGAAFAYYAIIPAAWAFLLQFETAALVPGIPLRFEGRINEYLALIMQLIFVFGLCFQLPLILLGLIKANLITVKALAKNRKYAFLGLMIIAAFLTPPDVFSMLGLALPLYGLYEGALLGVRLLDRA